MKKKENNNRPSPLTISDKKNGGQLEYVLSVPRPNCKQENSFSCTID